MLKEIDIVIDLLPKCEKHKYNGKSNSVSNICVETAPMGLDAVSSMSPVET